MARFVRMMANAGATGRVAVLAAGLLAAVFAAALAAPGAGGRPSAAELAVSDRYMGGRVVALRWMPDGARVVAVVRRGASSSAFVVSPDGSRRYVAVPVASDLDAYPAPAGDRVAIVRTRANMRARVAVVDVAEQHEDWSRWMPGPARLRWHEDGAAVAIAAADACWILSAGDGATMEKRPPVAPGQEC